MVAVALGVGRDLADEGGLVLPVGDGAEILRGTHRLASIEGGAHRWIDRAHDRVARRDERLAEPLDRQLAVKHVAEAARAGIIAVGLVTTSGGFRGAAGPIQALGLDRRRLGRAGITQEHR